MKALVFITIQMITVSLLACPDFSGNYLRDYDAEEITIAQPNCDKITYITSEREYPYVIDGKESLVGKYDIEGSEPGSIIASVEIYQSRAFKQSSAVKSLLLNVT